jgi:hypothetical protein
MAAVGLLDFSVQEFFDPLHYRSIDTAHRGGDPVFVRTGFMKFHGLVLLSQFMSLACLTKIYTRKGPMTIWAGCG